MTAARESYRQLSHDELVTRVMQLESQLRGHTSAACATSSIPPDTTPATAANPLAKKPKPKKVFDPSRYSTHCIALKFAYLGRNYNGFEHHVNNTTPLTTIEEELWRALMKARLIFPTPREPRNGQLDEAAAGQEPWKGPVNWNGCEYSKCGRTDRGVSAFGQVVALRVRSNRPPERRDVPLANSETADTQQVQEDGDAGSKKQRRPFDPVRDEINYTATLNRILPPDIRVLAWCPVPTPTFSARFSCKERRYKYFFTQPAFLPTPDTGAQSAFLDLERMRKAAEYLVGAHDFRNFCKIDGSKQISNFVRRVTHASIDEVYAVDMPSFFQGPGFIRGDHPDGAMPMKVCTFSLHGTAFLWHQVRCIMAVLFLVGQRLEEPEVIRELLDMSRCGTGRPRYEMANETPLVLWDCVFPLQPGDDDGKPYESGEHIDDAIQWRYPGDPSGPTGDAADTAQFDAQWGRNGLLDGLWTQWRGRKMDEILGGALLEKAALRGMPPLPRNGPVGQSTLVFDGSDSSRAVGKYVPLMRRERMEPVEIINARFATKRGLGAAKADGPSNDEDVDE